MMPTSKRLVPLTFLKFMRSRPLTKGSAFFNKYAHSNYSYSERVTNGGKVMVSNVRIKPQEVLPQSNDLDTAKDMVGDILAKDVKKITEEFLNRCELRDLVSNHGLDDYMFTMVKESFQKHYSVVQNLPVNLYIVISDLIKGKGNVLDLLPYFTKHIFYVYPHLQFVQELKKMANFQNPAELYLKARTMKRKIIFHYGPTNSGKTYHALNRFMEAETGIYCGPLKLLATEIHAKANKKGVPCDLLTGDDKRYVFSEDKPANHISCTVEMADINSHFQVAIIDEIQMMQCQHRGHAWTRALLGVAADEIHLCGEISALDYLKKQAALMNEEIECIEYKRLTQLIVESKAVKSLKNIRKGDCIVCFSKKAIFSICSQLKKIKIKFAIIYGTLPPGAKNKQSDYFNDVNSDCDVLVATDAIGLGVNLNIRRIVFFTLHRGNELISVSQALQIAGRAGRYKSCYNKGYVTAFHERDMSVLKSLLSQSVKSVNKAGIFPVAEQLETYSYYLPELQFNDLLDVFVSLAKVSDSYFMCSLDSMKDLSSRIEHLKMNIRDRYLFCTSPVNVKSTKALVIFTQFAKRFSEGKVITYSLMKKFLNWPPEEPSTLSELDELEEAYDCLELYLWFGNRLESHFPNKKEILMLQAKLEKIILKSLGENLMLKKDFPKEELVGGEQTK